ncbi:UNVERIFIED_CONTAM: hypothetical protein BJ099_102146 [Lysinibacillus xylanilyticus]
MVKYCLNAHNHNVGLISVPAGRFPGGVQLPLQSTYTHDIIINKMSVLDLGETPQNAIYFYLIRKALVQLFALELFYRQKHLLKEIKVHLHALCK